MNLKNYIPDGTRYQHLAQARQVGAANTIIEASEKKLNEVREQIESRPQFCDEDLKKDIRYKLGMIAGIKWVLDLPGEAQRYIKDLPEK